MSSERTKSSEVVHENPWWTYKHDRYLLPDGSEGDYYYAETNGNAVIIPLLDDGRLVLVRQYRYLQDKPSVEFPSGGPDSPDEVASKTAERELLEETGYRAAEMVKIGEFETSSGFCRDSTSLFVAWGLERVAEPNLEKTEEIEVIHRRIDEFNDMVKHGEIWDGQMLAAWAIARDYISRLVFHSQS